jgi:hypothetical protein
MAAKSQKGWQSSPPLEREETGLGSTMPTARLAESFVPSLSRMRALVKYVIMQERAAGPFCACALRCLQ